MKRFFRSRSLPALCTFLALIGVSHAQEDRSHEFDPNEPAPKDISKLLDARRGNRLAGVDSELLRQIMKNFDPSKFDENTIKKLLQDNPSLQDPKKLQQLKSLLEQFVRDPENVKGPKFDWAKLQQALKKLDQIQQKNKTEAPLNPPKETTEPTVAPKMEPQPQDRPPSPTSDRRTEELARWLSKNFGDSPAFENMAKELAAMMSKNGTGPNVLADFEKEWKSLVGRRNPKFTPPNLDSLGSDFKLTDLNPVGSSGGSLNFSPNIPDDLLPSSGGSGNRGSDVTSYLSLAMLAIAGMIFAFLWLRRGRRNMEFDGESKHTWPVAPGDVRSREDVVRAFEFLSVTKCGAVAVNWHHLQIAKQIGGEESDWREAAARLARLYEKARYAPLNELFTEVEIAEARARLQQLAGVPSA